MIIKQEEKLMLYLPARRQNGLQKWSAKYRTSRGRPGKSRQILLEGKSTERTGVSSMDYQFDVCFLKKAQSSVPSGIRASVRHAFQPELNIRRSASKTPTPPRPLHRAKILWRQRRTLFLSDCLIAKLTAIRCQMT